MKRIYVLLGMMMMVNLGWGQLLQQDFSSSTVVTDYVNAAPTNGQFNAISTSGAGVVISINTTTSNKLRFARTANAGIYSRTTDFSPVPTSMMYRFDLTVSGNSAAQTTAAVWQIGSGFGTGNSAEANASVHSRLGLNWTTTAGQFSLRDIAASNNTANYTGTQTVTFVINNSGGSLTYKAPDGTFETVADDRYDVWIGTTKEFDERLATTTTQTLTDIKFAFTGGVGTVDIDNILIDPIPPTPTSNPANPIGSTSFTANWTAVSGVTGYRIDVATDAGFTSYVTGYQDLYVSGQATNSLNVNTNINPSTTYYYRVRAASQYTVGEFASGNSSTQNLTTTSGSSPEITITGTPLAAFSTNAGTPSSVQTYSVSGTNLTDDILIDAPTGYQIRTGANPFGTSITLNQSGGVVNSTNIDVRLNANVAGNFNGDINHSSTSATDQDVAVTGSVGLAAPVSNAPNTFTANSFTAGWTAVTGANSYRLDASASSSFSTPGSITSEGFENTLILFTETSGTGSFFTGNSAVGEAPANSPFAVAGTYSYGMNSGSVTITSSNINTSAATNVEMSFRLASFSVNFNTNGADVGDIVTVEISPDGGTNYYSTIRVLGNNNAWWAYSATGVASTAYDGNSSPIDFQPAGGAERTTDGYSTVTVTGLPSVSNLRIRITILNNNANELWVIDDLSVTGNVGSFLPGYENLSVPGTSQVVTVPGPGTYYFRARGTDGTFTSSNSNVVTVVINDEDVSAFRSTASGNYDDAGTWEFNVSPPSFFAAATQEPTATNDVTIRNGHTVMLTANAAADELILEATGNVTLGNNNLTVNNVVGGTAASYIRTNGTGSLIINDIDASAKIFPIGNSTFNQLIISNGSGHNWSARVTDAVNNVQPPFNTDKAVLRTWTITPSVNPPSAGANLTFQYDDADATQIGGSFITTEDVQLWHYGAAWVAASGALSPTGTPGGVRTVTRNGWSVFSDFAIANISGPLPVNFVSFSGYREGSRNLLRWTTATESNNRGFEVQRSTDGINYSAIGFVNTMAPGGNSTDQLSYTFTDNAPAGLKQYYRLRQEDWSGTGKLSNIVLIRGSKPTSLSVEAIFPNPARTHVNLVLAAPVSDQVTLVLNDALGRTVMQRVVRVEPGSNTIPLDISGLRSGSYFVRVVCSDGCEATGQLLKQ